MDSLAFVIIALFILGFGLLSGRLQKSFITPPMVFVLFGLIISSRVLGIVHLDMESEVVHLLAELTLILVLFTDASRIDLSVLRREYYLPLRLLGIGLPLTIFLGLLLAAVMFTNFTLWEAAIVATVLAPTDAALGQAVVSSPRIPVRIRQALNVESGLNDGIAVPVISILIALASMTSNPGAASYWTEFTVRQILLGPLVGIVVGYLGGRLIQLGAQSHWMNHTFHQLSGLALALLAFALAELVVGNGLIAAFCAGLTIGNTAPNICGRLYEFAEAEGQLLVLFTFMVFGAVMVWPAIDHFNWLYVLYGLLSLTLVRMLAVAISLIGSHLQSDTVLFLGWFGPRGVASILFGLLVLAADDIAVRDEIFAVVVITILISVFAHGLTSVAGANWYAGRAEAMSDEPDMPEFEPVTDMPVRIPYRE